MFKSFIFLLLFLSFMVGAQSCISSKPHKDNNINGSWSENWGAGEETNVTYSDVYVIKQITESKIEISCPKRQNYVFEEVSFDGNKVTIRLVIKDLKYGQEDSWVKYDLDLQQNKSSFVGTAQTKAGKKVKIIWTKLSL
jgi:hypothetical protein